MKGYSNKVMWAASLAGLLCVGAGSTFGQSPSTQNPPAQQQQPQPQQPQQQPLQQQPQNGNAPAQGNNQGNTTGLTLDTAPPPVSAEEETAYKAFEVVAGTDLQKKIAAGEDFLQKYPESRYRPPVYSALTIAYLQSGQAQKAFEIGDKEIQLKPDDVQTLAILSQSIPRAFDPKSPDAQQQLDKAENYGKRAIDIVPTMTKPASLPDDKFEMAKNQTLAMAHGGVGLVYLRRGKFDEAIPELEQSIKLDPNPTADPVNYYLLGIANEKTSHFDAAATAFAKCGEISGALQQTCKSGAEQAKKQGSSQLSAPN